MSNTRAGRHEWNHILRGEAAEDFSHLVDCLKMRLTSALAEHVEFEQAVKKEDHAINPSLERLLKSKQSIIFSMWISPCKNDFLSSSRQASVTDKPAWQFEQKIHFGLFKYMGVFQMFALVPHHINEPFALLTPSPSRGCGGTRARALSRNPQRALPGFSDGSKMWSCTHHPFPIRLPFNHPLGPSEHRDTNEKEMANGNTCIRLHSSQGLLREWWKLSVSFTYYSKCPQWIELGLMLLRCECHNFPGFFEHHSIKLHIDGCSLLRA